MLLVTLCTTASFAQPKLNSFTSATSTIFLDFDGHTVNGTLWNAGEPIVCAPAPLSNAQVTEIFNRVSEDYRPFNVNITTDSLVYLAAPLAQRIRVIVTPSSAWKPGVGGVSFVGSFTWGDDTPAFVFTDRLGPNNSKYIAECCSHESGHTLGLSHQSSYDTNCNLTETYNTGAGSGETGWAPVMGNSYYKNMTGWNDGPTPYGCALVQDNLTIITSTNGFGYRTDDFSEAMDANCYSPSSTSFSVDGIISTSTDKDAFRFLLNAQSTLHIDAVPFNLGANNTGANLDIKIMLYDGSNTLLRTYDPAAQMKVTIDTTLNAGTYYFVLDGTGNANTSNYGSLGSYTLTGFKSALPIHSVVLNGNTDKNKHNLSWNIVADEPIKSQLIEYSNDGINFKPLTATASAARGFSYNPFDGNTRYYRLKITSVIEQTAYSNIVALRGIGKTENVYTVSTFVTSQVIVNAYENYQFKLMDANGRILQIGNGTKGINSLDVSNKPAGMYILQLYNNNQIHTERIIKQ